MKVRADVFAARPRSCVSFSSDPVPDPVRSQLPSCAPREFPGKFPNGRWEAPRVAGLIMAAAVATLRSTARGRGPEATRAESARRLGAGSVWSAPGKTLAEA